MRRSARGADWRCSSDRSIRRDGRAHPDPGFAGQEQGRSCRIVRRCTLREQGTPFTLAPPSGLCARSRGFRRVGLDGVELDAVAIYIIQFPQSKALVGIKAAGVEATLVDHGRRRGKRERRTFEIQRSPRSGWNVQVLTFADKGRHQKISGSAALEIPQRCRNVQKRKVHEAIAAQDEVTSGERIATDIRVEKTCVWRAVFSLICVDQVRYHVDADIGVEPHIDRVLPVEITAAGVKQRPDAKLIQERGQIAAKRGSSLKPGAGTRRRFTVTPKPLPVDVAKYVLHFADLNPITCSPAPEHALGDTPQRLTDARAGRVWNPAPLHLSTSLEAAIPRVISWHHESASLLGVAIREATLQFAKTAFRRRDVVRGPFADLRLNHIEGQPASRSSGAPTRRGLFR